MRKGKAVMDISTTAKAQKKIFKDLSIRSSLSTERIVPIIGYYYRSYFTSLDGEKTECGPGIILSFLSEARTVSDQYLPVDFKGGRVFFSPKEYFQSGTHQVYVASGRLEVKSS
ncbi:MAG: hypothetical protein KGH91_07960 [Rhodospirillales bacterium]|nr:hypothetical protein [Rhodospirillales bacterium]